MKRSGNKNVYVEGSRKYECKDWCQQSKRATQWSGRGIRCSGKSERRPYEQGRVARLVSKAMSVRNIKKKRKAWQLQSEPNNAHWHHSMIKLNLKLYSCGCILVKVKVTLIQALRLYTGRSAHRGSRGIALPFHYHGTRRGWGVSVTPRPLFTPRKDPVPIVQEVGWAPGPVWTGAENIASHGDSIPGPSSP